MFKVALRLNSQTLKANLGKGLGLSILALSLNGCSYLEPYKAPVVQGNVMNQESIELLQKGLNKNQVRQLLGPPTGENPFNDSHWEYTYYSTEKNAKTVQRSKHLVIQFDEYQLLSDWQQVDQDVQLKKRDSWLGLGWF